ncbi:MAG TPA: hypothetical protein VJN39_14270 [Gemmatimonadales bacterium]|nr:hypothetical protein [Gemmatimonadales bacterium]
MTRIVAVLLVAAGLSGIATPSAAQQALKTFTFGAARHVDPRPTPFVGSLAASTQQAFRVGAVSGAGRVSLSTATITGLPERASWNQTHTVLASAFVVTLLIDAAQTRELARHGWSGFRESNPLLGDRPTVGQVNAYTAIAGLSVLGAAAALPPKVRPWLLGAAIAVQAFTVAGSVQKGLPIRFP